MGGNDVFYARFHSFLLITLPLLLVASLQVIFTTTVDPVLVDASGFFGEILRTKIS